MKAEKAPGPSDVLLDLIAVGEGEGIQVMIELCQRLLDRWGSLCE